MFYLEEAQKENPLGLKAFTLSNQNNKNENKGNISLNSFIILILSSALIFIIFFQIL